MTHRGARWGWRVVGAGWLALSLSWLGPGEAVAEVRAGAAAESFALPERVPLAGYSRRHGAPSRGIRDPVAARALVLQDGGSTAALVSAEILIIDEPLFDAVRERLRAAGFPREGVLVLAATHTHSGPGAYGRRFLEKLSMGHFDPRVFESLVQAITQAVLRAAADLRPVSIASAVAETEQLVRNRMDPDGLVDAELSVSGLYRPGAPSPFAVLVGFAAHPTTLGADNMLLSGDYPGTLMREVERRLPGAQCLFFAGAVGDQAPVKTGQGGADTDRLGARLADGALAALDRARAQPPARLAALQEVVPLPPARVRLGALTLPRWIGRRLVDDDATLSVVAVGPLMLLGAPCDVAAPLGARLKQASRHAGWHPLVVGFASDYVGYCLPAAAYAQRRYEVSMAFNGPDAGDLVVEHLRRMMQRLAAGAHE